MRSVAEWKTVERALGTAETIAADPPMVTLANAEALVNNPLFETMLFELEREAFFGLKSAGTYDDLIVHQAKIAAVETMRTWLENLRYRAEQEIKDGAGR